MNKRRTLTVLLTTVAVLLAADVGLRLERGAGADEMAAGGGEPYIVTLLHAHHQNFQRVWSDGRVDELQRTDGNCDYEVVFTHGPVEHPFPVVDARLGANHDVRAVMMEYEDGRVDLVALGERCTIAGVGSQSFCTADTDRNGEVDFDDLLRLLAQWGVCEG